MAPVGGMVEVEGQPFDESAVTPVERSQKIYDGNSPGSHIEIHVDDKPAG